jgi:CBS domain-containing protein
VEDVMRPQVTTVEAGAHVAAAAYLMNHAGATALMIRDGRTDQPIGIITQADIARAIARGKDATCRSSPTATARSASFDLTDVCRALTDPEVGCQLHMAGAAEPG